MKSYEIFGFLSFQPIKNSKHNIFLLTLQNIV